MNDSNVMQAYLHALDSDVIEVRILRKQPYLQLQNTKRRFVGDTVSGYYEKSEVEKLAADIQPYENDPDTKAIYSTLHRLDPALLARSKNRLREGEKGDMTSDGDVTHFTVFPIDLDPERVSGVSSSETELKQNREVAAELAGEFEQMGIPIVKALSGNGYHILVFIEPLLVDDENIHRFKRAGDIVAARWGTDAKVYNPSRIWKLYGTTAKKGDPTPERPHRKAEIFDPKLTYQRIGFYDLEQMLLEKWGDLINTGKPAEKQSAGGGKRLPPLDTRDALEKLAIECGATLVGEWKTKVEYQCVRTFCPLCSRDSVGVLTYSDSGQCGWSCHTNTCNEKNLEDLYTAAGYSKSQNARSASNYTPLLKEKKEATGVNSPEMPDGLFFGNFEYLYDAFLGKGNFYIDTPFLLAMGLSAVGAVSERMRYITPYEDAPVILFPNQYTVLVGESYYAAKSDTREQLIRLIENAYEFTDKKCAISFLSSVVSKQGLLDVLDTEGWVDCFDGVTALLHFDEMKAMFATMRRDYATDVQSLVNTLWKCPTREQNPAKTNKIEAFYPVLNVFGLSTRDWLNSALIKDDLTGGFMNRFMTFYSDGLNEYVSKPKIDKNSYDKFVARLKILTDVPDNHKAIRFVLDDEAFEIYDKFCKEQWQDGRNDTSKNIGTRRSSLHTLKIALSLHIINEPNTHTIGFECISKAIEITKYICDVGKYLYADVVSHESAKIEQRLLNLLNRNHNSMPRRKIQQSLQDAGFREVGKVIDGLIAENILYVNTENLNIEVQKIRVK